MKLPRKQYPIQVRQYQPGQSQYGSESIGKITGDYGKFDILKTIKRPLWSETSILSSANIKAIGL